MRRIYLICMIIILSLLLASCSLGGNNSRRNFLMTDDRAIANKQFEDLIDAAKMQDADALKALFSQNVLNEVENIEESIQKLFDYFEGEMVSYNDWAGPGVTAKNDADGYWKQYYSTYDLETTQDKYRLAMEIIPVDTADADNVGIRSLYIIRFEDDTDQNCAYRGDGAYTPGINIGKTE